MKCKLPVLQLLAILVSQVSILCAADERPNILFCISDDQSFPHASAYGCQWVQTPAFDRVAEAGLLFMNAYTPTAKCSTSRASIITGRNGWQLEAAGNHIFYYPEKFVTYVEALVEQSDYFVGYTGKGVVPVVAKGRALVGPAFNKHKVKKRLPSINPTDYSKNFKAFLEARPEGRPFCFWYGSREPHRPYRFGIGSQFGGKQLADIDEVPGFWPDTPKVRQDMLDYAYEVEHFDKHLAEILQTLEDAGELDNTLVVVTSDNGMPFPRVKGVLYEYSNHMPLAIMWPNGIANPGRTITDYVSFIDFAPTFLELAGVSPAAGGMQPIEGRSLTPIFRSEKLGRVEADRDYVLLGQERQDVGRPNDVGYPIRAIVKEGYLYLHNFETGRWPMGPPETGYQGTGGSPTKTEVLDLRRKQGNTHYWDLCFGKRDAEELYDIRKDPSCVNNLIDNPEYSPKAAALKEQLFAELKAQGDPRMFGEGHVFDEYPWPWTGEVDFYNRFMRGELGKDAIEWINKSDYEAPVN